MKRCRSRSPAKPSNIFTVVDKYHIDFETYSAADIRKVGGHRYARDHSTEVLCLAISRNGSAPLVWTPHHDLNDPIEQMEATDMLHSLDEDNEALVYAHNASFEFEIWNSTMVGGKTYLHLSPLTSARMRCTAAMARRAAIPHSLAKCAEYLGLSQQKSTRGTYLINKLSIPQKPDKNHADVWRRHPHDDPKLFAEMLAYCAQDVRTEMEVEKALRLFDVGGFVHDVFALDLDLNARGFPVDLDALHRAQKMVEAEVSAATEQFHTLTGFAPTQTGVLLNWLREHGYRGTDLKAGTMDGELDDWHPDTSDLDEVAKQALELRRLTSYAATKKIKSMIAVAGPDDNRVRGTLFYHGATTGRWSSKLVQQQNFKRSTDESEQAFRLLRSGARTDVIELMHGPILETLAGSIRHFINDGDEPLDTVDYAAIEARIVCWLAGQEDALKEFREGVDRYKTMAGRIFKCDPTGVDKKMRFLGKQSVLGCGFGMGATKFQGTCASYGEQIDMELAELAVTTFRSTHKQVVALWYSLERACKNAINSPGQKFSAGEHLSAFTGRVAGKLFLFIRLPSGRMLSYPDPRIVPEHNDRLTFHGQIAGKAIWGRVETYGGKLVENVTQGVAADVMGVGALNATRAGHQIVMLVHDEAVRLTRGSKLTLEHFVKCLTDMPAWAKGLPLAAEGNTIEFYTK